MALREKSKSLSQIDILQLAFLPLWTVVLFYQFEAVDNLAEKLFYLALIALNLQSLFLVTRKLFS